MYLEGGVYLDIKTMPKVPLDSLLFPEGALVVCESHQSGPGIGDTFFSSAW